MASLPENLESALRTTFVECFADGHEVAQNEARAEAHAAEERRRLAESTRTLNRVQPGDMARHVDTIFAAVPGLVATFYTEAEL